MKDFAAEIRASIDVENFLAQAKLMLDLNETNVETILDRMLHTLLDKEEASVIEDALKATFTHDGGRFRLSVPFKLFSLGLLNHLCNQVFHLVTKSRLSFIQAFCIRFVSS